MQRGGDTLCGNTLPSTGISSTCIVVFPRSWWTQGNEDAVQHWVFAGEGSPGRNGLIAGEDPGPSVDRRPSGATTVRRRRELDLRVVSGPLQLPRRVPGAEEGEAAVDGDPARGGRSPSERRCHRNQGSKTSDRSCADAIETLCGRGRIKLPCPA